MGRRVCRHDAIRLPFWCFSSSAWDAAAAAPTFADEATAGDIVDAGTDLRDYCFHVNLFYDVVRPASSGGGASGAPARA